MSGDARFGHLVATLVAAALVAACVQNQNGAQEVERPPLTTTATATTTTTPTLATTTSASALHVFALRPPAPPESPAALAGQIAAAEGAIRDPASDEIEIAEAALAQQVAYRQMGSHQEWDAEVLAALPHELRGTALRNAAARREFRGMHTRLKGTLPAWRIVEPLPIDELVAIYQQAGDEFDIPWQYLAAVNLVETAIGRIRGTSTAGAQGPMQFLPSTWEAYGAGGDINDARDAIRGAARYLAANNGATDIDNALYRYNHSDRYVRGVRLYADLIVEHPRAFLGYYHWGVWYLTDAGDVYLPVGYAQRTPIPVADYQE